MTYRCYWKESAYPGTRGWGLQSGSLDCPASRFGLMRAEQISADQFGSNQEQDPRDVQPSKYQDLLSNPKTSSRRFQETPKKMVSGLKLVDLLNLHPAAGRQAADAGCSNFGFVILFPGLPMVGLKECWIVVGFWALWCLIFRYTPMARLRRGGDIWVIRLGLLGYAGVAPPAHPVGLFQTCGQDPGRLVHPEEEFDPPDTQLPLRRFCAANKHQIFHQDKIY